MDFHTLSIIAFIVFVGIAIWKKREKIEVEGLVVLYKTKRFIEIIDRIAKKSPRAWKIIGIISIIICFYFMFFGVFYLIENAVRVAKDEIKESGIKLVLPAPVKNAEIGYAHIFLPFWIWILTIFFILFPHEFAHGIMARVEKIRLKSVGLLLFLIFPGAFVEPDEKQLKRKKLIAKLRVFSAGSFANIVVSFLVFLLASHLWFFLVDGVYVKKVVENSPAELAGIKEGMIIKSINGKELFFDFGFYSNFVLAKQNPEDVAARIYLVGILTNWSFSNYTFKPGDSIVIETDKGNFTVTLGEHPQIEKAPFIGIVVGTKCNGFEFLFKFLAILSLLSFAVAVVNILPLYPLDGGHMIKAILEEKLSEEQAIKITKIISFFILSILLYSFFGPLV
ncbi:MAG TPA: hypothetical protein EYH56_00675 [Nanoarchaeota archaeon]|nr:hypothetical protein [Nanoarchaeota archaeon]